MYGKSRLYLKRSSPTILCCMAAVGVVGTAVAAVKVTPRAMKLLEDATDCIFRRPLLELAQFYVFLVQMLSTSVSRHN